MKTQAVVIYFFRPEYRDLHHGSTRREVQSLCTDMSPTNSVMAESDGHGMSGVKMMHSQECLMQQYFLEVNSFSCDSEQGWEEGEEMVHSRWKFLLQQFRLENDFVRL